MTQSNQPPPDWTQPTEPAQPVAPPPAPAPPPADPTQPPPQTLPPPPPQPPTQSAGPAAPTATRGDKLRLFLILGGIAAFIGIVLFMTRDNQMADDLAAGQCFDVPADADFSTVTRKECTEPHDAEVFHVAEYTGDAYPISLSLDSFIDEECVPAFQAYTGSSFGEQEALAIGYIYPTRAAWDNGDRTVTCYALNDDESKLTSPVRSGT